MHVVTSGGHSEYCTCQGMNVGTHGDDQPQCNYGFETLTLASLLQYDDRKDPSLHLDLLTAVRHIVRMPLTVHIVTRWPFPFIHE